MTEPKYPDDYEFIEVKVSRKIDIKLSLDDLINGLQQDTAALASVPPQIADRLSQLANKLKGEA